MTQPVINLIPAENHLFQLLRDCINHFKLKTNVRVAGGWVRDKLLNKPTDCTDLDIVVDSCSGVEFANYFSSFLQEKLDFKPSIGIVKQNPDQSKHLETAVISFQDFSIDFCQFRTEMYDSDSRIPQIIPIEDPVLDAQRRDFTINSLYYNISTRSVEDFLGVGVDHLLVQKLIKTPIDPIITFQDDPLRILRMVRFATQFPEMSIDDSTWHAAQLSSNLSKISNIITKERIGEEFMKTISNPSHSVGICKLHQLGLDTLILNGEYTPKDPNTSNTNEFDENIQFYLNHTDSKSPVQDIVASLYYNSVQPPNPNPSSSSNQSHQTTTSYFKTYASLKIDYLTLYHDSFLKIFRKQMFDNFRAPNSFSSNVSQILYGTWIIENFPFDNQWPHESFLFWNFLMPQNGCLDKHNQHDPLEVFKTCCSFAHTLPQFTIKTQTPDWFDRKSYSLFIPKHLVGPEKGLFMDWLVFSSFHSSDSESFIEKIENFPI